MKYDTKMQDKKDTPLIWHIVPLQAVQSQEQRPTALLLRVSMETLLYTHVQTTGNKMYLF